MLEKVGTIILHNMNLLEMQTKWNGLGLARLAATPGVGGNVILLLAPSADFFFLSFPATPTPASSIVGETNISSQLT